jgi:Rad3-related DNA helicase
MDAACLAHATEALRAFEAFVAVEFGDRATLDTVLSERVLESRAAFDLRQRAFAFKARAALRGVQADLVLSAGIVYPSAAGTERHDAMGSEALLGCRRLEPSGLLRLNFSSFTADDARCKPFNLAGQPAAGMDDLLVPSFSTVQAAQITTVAQGRTIHSDAQHSVGGSASEVLDACPVDSRDAGVSALHESAMACAVVPSVPRSAQADADRPQPHYAIAVRELCAFTAKSGDLDLRCTPAPTAQQGIAGHQSVAARRSPTYQSEVTLSATLDGLLVRGRADGYDPATGRLEEIKTHRGDAARIPENHRRLHLAQAETYAHLKCLADGLGEIDVAVVYFEIGTQAETPIERRYAADELAAIFAARCEQFASWAARELAHRACRNRALTALAFPHGAFRAGQRHLAEAVYRCARDGGQLLAQAPTGIGKTLGTLFPALKALAQQALDKVFFLAAKTSGRQLAVECLRALGNEGKLPLRVLELVARDALCEHPDKACHGDSCPLARGFYDRLPHARAAAMEAVFLDRASTVAVARQHGICPYYLTQELVRWADVVVGDYNHYFDTSALLHAMTVANDWRVAVLVDEAHNLVERARAMYTAELHRDDLRIALRSAPAELRPSLQRLDRRWQQFVADQTEPYRVHDALPTAFVDGLDSAIGAIAEFQAEHPEGLGPELLAFFFGALHFSRLAASFGAHSIFDVTLEAAPATARGRQDSSVCLRNVIPAPHLDARLAAARAAMLFSATLAPAEFYRRMLGLRDHAKTIDVESPFLPEQLRVRVTRSISTRYRDRRQSLGAVADLIAAQFESEPGNYIAFFGSFEYLGQAADRLSESHPKIPIWRQMPQMSGHAQEEFLARFEDDGQGIAFAVLGGRFGEGIDLPGTRLVGTFIATLGMPPLNPVNEEMRRVMAAQFGAGYEYTYLYPGLRKVVQAAGRVIRTASDRGVVNLIDDRYAQPRILGLLPSWWDVRLGAFAD